MALFKRRSTAVTPAPAPEGSIASRIGASGGAIADRATQYYQQYLLYADPKDRFSVVSFVWGPGQKTPVHDHTVWGVIGMLRGSERCTAYKQVGGRIAQDGEDFLLERGEVEMVSPAIGDIHSVANAFDDRVSVSIHAYGANIGKVKRHVFDPQTGASKEFISGYANAT